VADATGCAVNQDALVCLHPGDVDEALPGGQSGKRQSGGVHLGGQGSRPIDLHQFEK
jgi:hypothetical protein